MPGPIIVGSTTTTATTTMSDTTSTTTSLSTTTATTTAPMPTISSGDTAWVLVSRRELHVSIKSPNFFDLLFVKDVYSSRISHGNHKKHLSHENFLLEIAYLMFENLSRSQELASITVMFKKLFSFNNRFDSL